MIPSKQAFRASCYSLLLAALSVASLPIGLAITSRDNQTWDYLSDDINFLSVVAVLFVGFLLTSFVSGCFALKERKVAAFWVVPLGICFVVAAGMGLFALYIYIFDPHGM